MMKKPPHTGALYPGLPSGADVSDETTNQPLDQYFRLQEISRLRKQLEDEKEKHSRVYKKYSRWVNVLCATDTTLLSASMLMGVGGVGLLSTIIAAPIVVGLEAAALGCGLLSIAGKFASRRLSVKAKKHSQIRILADSKLNTISDHVSKALTDGQISEEEFHKIVGEIHKYTQMKSEIRAGAKKAHTSITLDEEAKNALIQQGRDEAKAKFMEKLASP